VSTTNTESNDTTSSIPLNRLDPVSHAIQLVKSEKYLEALGILQPILEDMIANGETPSPDLEEALEKIIEADASSFGVTPK
jgi:hypothetical protein